MKIGYLLILVAFFVSNLVFGKSIQSKTHKNQLLIQQIKAKHKKNAIRAKAAAQLLKFSLSPENPKVQEDLTLFIQPLTGFTDSDMFLEVQMNQVDVTNSLEQPTKEMWVLTLGKFSELRSHQIQAKVFIQDKNAAELLTEAIAQLDLEIAEIDTQLENEVDPEVIADLQAVRTDKLAQKTDLAQTLAGLKTELVSENFTFNIYPDNTQPGYPQYANISPRVIQENTPVEVVLNGAYFNPSTTVKISSADVTISSRTENQLILQVPGLSQGLYDIEIRNTDSGVVKNSIHNGVLFVSDGYFSDPTTPPTAVISGYPMQVPWGQSVSLSSDNSFDSNHKPIRYEWRFVSVPTNSQELVTPTPISTTAQFNFNPSVPGIYVLELKVIQTQSPFLSSQPTYAAIESVAPANRFPSIAVLPASTAVLTNATTTFQIGFSDPDFWQNNNVFVSRIPNLGNLSFAVPGQVSYQAGNQTGADNFEISVIDNGNPARISSFMVNVTVVSGNVAPTISSVFTQNRTEGLPIRVLIAGIGIADSDSPIAEIKVDCGDNTYEYAPTSGVNLGVVLHTYQNFGTYNGSISIKDIHGAVTTQNFTVNVVNTDLPKASFKLNQFHCASAPCSITADASATTDSNGVSSFRWLWDDNTAEEVGGTVTHSVRTHTYNTNGTYRIRLRVRDPYQAQAEVYATVYVGATAPAGGSPVSGALSVSPMRQVLTNTLLTMNMSGSFDPNPSSQIESVIWNFGCLTGTCTDSSMPSATYQYAQAFNYYPTLTMTNTLGGVTVSSPAEIFVVNQGAAPRVNVKVNNQIPLGADVIMTSPATLFLDASPSFDYDGTIQSYLWDFADGTQANTAMTIKTFFNPGVYLASLKVIDNDGNPVKQFLKIIINSPANLKNVNQPSVISPELDQNLTNACGSGSGSACSHLADLYRSNEFVSSHLRKQACRFGFKPACGE